MKVLLLVLITSLYLSASNGFVTPKELNALLENKNLVLIDITDKETYNAGHLPNASLANVDDFRKQVQKHQLMKSSSEIEAIARSLGINNDSIVVIYGHGKKKELLKSSYVALSLIVNGAKNVSLLNGQYDDYAREFKVEKETPKVKKGNFTAVYNPDILVDLEYVKSHIGKIPMLEARSPEYYYGTEISNGVQRAGHIPKAMSSFWKDKFNKNNTLRSKEDLDTIFMQGYGLQKEDEVILYCTGGLEASMNWYILYQNMGLKHAKLYDASMKEWGNRNDTPITKFKWETFTK